jgi:hypothetical protein
VGVTNAVISLTNTELIEVFKFAENFKAFSARVEAEAQLELQHTRDIIERYRLRRRAVSVET